MDKILTQHVYWHNKTFVGKTFIKISVFDPFWPHFSVFSVNLTIAGVKNFPAIIKLQNSFF